MTRRLGSASYAATALPVAAACAWSAAQIGLGLASAIWTGSALAWLIQVVSYDRLASKLDAGRDATRTWVAGIAARAGGLGVAWVAGLGEPGRPEIALTYAGTMLVLLLFEAAWLARRGWPGSSMDRSRSTDEKEDLPDDAGSA